MSFDTPTSRSLDNDIVLKKQLQNQEIWEFSPSHLFDWPWVTHFSALRLNSTYEISSCFSGQSANSWQSPCIEYLLSLPGIGLSTLYMFSRTPLRKLLLIIPILQLERLSFYKSDHTSHLARKCPDWDLSWGLILLQIVNVALVRW